MEERIVRELKRSCHQICFAVNLVSLLFQFVDHKFEKLDRRNLQQRGVGSVLALARVQATSTCSF